MNIKNSKILVTGSSGFIGSHLVEFLIEKGANIIAFDRYNSNNDYGWLNNTKYKDKIEFVLGDVRDFDLLNNLIQKADKVIHLAALIGIPYSYLSPLAYIRTNIEGTYNVLESCKNNNNKEVIITSTSEVYGSAQYVPIDELHPKVGQSPYSASKISADQISISYYRSFDLPVKIIRPFNVYGPRQSTRAIIPTIIKQCINNEKIIKLGNTNPTRDFTYVLDTCEAIYNILISKKTIGEELNIGTGKEISIKDLASLIMNKLSTDKILKVDNVRIRTEKSEVDRLCCNSEKLNKLINWRSRIDLDKGLDLTIEWFKKNHTYLSENYHV